MFKRLFFILFGLILCSGEAWSVPEAQKYSKFFDVDLNAKLPSREELVKKYVVDNPEYDNRYSFGWNIGNVFDKIFSATIVNYGSSEVRLRSQSEEVLLNTLATLPKESFEYIGPYLHTVPGISDKILNLPGIKETKNKFPSRIAPQLKDIEDLEFLSPVLYFVLMPEAWPEFYKNKDRPKTKVKVYNPKVEYNPKLFETIDKYVTVDEFVADKNAAPKITKSDLRTINISKSSPLTSADIKAFGRTLPKVYEFGEKGDNKINLIHVGSLLNAWEQENGKALPVNMIKDLVNPCQRLVQKIRIAGLEQEFSKTVGGEGFNINEWAYTCDKTIKAYRVSMISSSMVLAIRLYNQGVYDSSIAYMNDNNKAVQYSTIQSVVEMYKAPINDVLEARKNRAELAKEFRKMQGMLIVNPISRLE